MTRRARRTTGPNENGETVKKVTPLKPAQLQTIIIIINSLERGTIESSIQQFGGGANPVHISVDFFSSVKHEYP